MDEIQEVKGPPLKGLTADEIRQKIYDAEKCMLDMYNEIKELDFTDKRWAAQAITSLENSRMQIVRSLYEKDNGGHVTSSN